MDLLIDIHGQHDHQALIHQHKQLEIVDRSGGKKLKEGFLLGWCLFALFFILAGIIPALSFCTGTFAVFSGPAQMILSAFLVLFLFKISEYVSVLSRKNQELAMQVSLLNQENERILTELQQLTGKNKTEL